MIKVWTCLSWGRLACRYLMYIEADAWATNLKQKLACGSVLMSAKMEFYEFFTRALQPNVHYVEVSTKDMCLDTAQKVPLQPALCPAFYSC